MCFSWPQYGYVYQVGLFVVHIPCYYWFGALAFMVELKQRLLIHPVCWEGFWACGPGPRWGNHTLEIIGEGPIQSAKIKWLRKTHGLHGLHSIEKGPMVEGLRFPSIDYSYFYMPKQTNSRRRIEAWLPQKQRETGLGSFLNGPNLQRSWRWHT